MGAVVARVRACVRARHVPIGTPLQGGRGVAIPTEKLTVVAMVVAMLQSGRTDVKVPCRLSGHVCTTLCQRQYFASSSCKCQKTTKTRNPIKNTKTTKKQNKHEN